MKKVSDYGKGSDEQNVQAIVHILERIQESSVWTVDKFLDPFGDAYALGRRGLPVGLIAERARGHFLGRASFKGNCLLNEGINELWTLVAGTGATKFDNGNAYLGVGDTATAADPAQTGLLAPANKLYKAMDGGYPVYGSSQKATWRSTFGTIEANFDWNEFTVANGDSDDAVNLNRRVSAIGTKTGAMSWILTLDVTLI